MIAAVTNKSFNVEIIPCTSSKSLVSASIVSKPTSLPAIVVLVSASKPAIYSATHSLFNGAIPAASNAAKVFTWFSAATAFSIASTKRPSSSVPNAEALTLSTNAWTSSIEYSSASTANFCCSLK